MIQIIKRYVPIIGALAFAYFVSGLASSTVFMYGTPTIRPNLSQYVAQRIKGQMSRITASLGLLKKKSGPSSVAIDYALLEKKMEKLPFSQLSKGVYAKDDGTNSITVIKTGELDTVEYSFVQKGADGKDETIKIRVPKDFPYSEQQFISSMDK